MSRFFYSLLWVAGLPLILARLLWRARRQRDYLRHLDERFGLRPPSPPQPCLWVHAVSVGETRAAQPLVKALLDAFPAHQVLLTHMTPTGRETGRDLFGKEARVTQSYLPYDLPFAAQRFLSAAQPAAGIVMETEVWPNLMAAARRAGTPVLLANARLSEKSAKGYRQLGALARRSFGAFRLVAAQSAEDAARLVQAGAHDVRVTGNIKYDIETDPSQTALGEHFRRLASSRKVLLLASSREGEEAMFIQAFAAIASHDVLLVIVPRHPQRFGDVAALVEEKGLTLQRRSSDAPVEASTRVWLGDSMGEMAAYCSMADAAIIGGSWQKLGGHNLLEACAAGVPVLLGPHTFNFTEASQKAIEAGAARRCGDAEEAVRVAFALLQDEAQRQRMGEAGRRFVAAHGGATKRTLELVREILG